MILMVIQRLSVLVAGERGDTLVEVVMALAILCFVLLGATALALGAFRGSQTARERVVIADLAQQQMEALRSFRDNHTWDEFRAGKVPAYKGIDNVAATPCLFDPAKHCFHMQLASTGVNTEWVPVPGGLAGPVPTSVLEMWADTSGAALTARPCNYDITLNYSFTPDGGGSVKISNHVRTRLANLKYDPLILGAGICL